MAKKKLAAKPAEKSASMKLNARDKRTMGQIVDLADAVVKAAERRRDLHLDIPSRSLSNVRYNKSKRFIEMGSGTNRRELFNLSQAKSYMQTLLVGSGCKQLIEQGKTTSLRGLYYMLKHTIEGTKEETFDDQDECDPIIEDVEVTLNALREELHLYAKNARRDGRPDHARRQRRRDRLLADGLRRLQHPVDRRAGGRSSSRSATPSSSCTSKRTPSGGASTKTSSGRSTTASSRTAAASRRAACGGCCIACTTS